MGRIAEIRGVGGARCGSCTRNFGGKLDEKIFANIGSLTTAEGTFYSDLRLLRACPRVYIFEFNQVTLGDTF